MLKIFLLLTILISLVYASINDINSKIKNNKKQFSAVSSKKSNINQNISTLASKINKEENAYDDIVSILEKTNNQLLLNRIRLSSTITKIKKLKEKSTYLSKRKNKMEKDVIDFVVEKYALSMGIEQANKESLKDIIGKEVYTLVFDNVRQDIIELNINYLKINNSIRDNEKKIKDYNQYILKQKAIKKKFLNLELAQEKTLENLKVQHKAYQGNLKKLINKQNQITNLLGNLNILKKKEIKKEKKRIKKAKALAKRKEIERKKRLKKEALAKKLKELTKQKLAKKTKTIKFKKRKKLDKEIDIEVKKIGSSTKGVKISAYNGKTTIAPLKAYTVTKEFGKYYDKVYKMELFNESVSLKTKKPNAKVFSVFKGQVVYAKKNFGLLANVVIVKHRGNLHTIYSHLDKISPTLKAGKWIPKGYVVGRVNNTLEFQATKNSKYINPMKLIK